MSEEGKDDVEEIQPDKDGKYPETVPWSKYVGIKESLGGKLTTERGKVTNLEEQLKNAPNPEEFNKIKEELEKEKTKNQESSEELNKIKEKSASELRDSLKAKGVPEEEIKAMSETEMRVALKYIGDRKPLPDLGGGGGGGNLQGRSPMDLARTAYEKK